MSRKNPLNRQAVRYLAALAMVALKPRRVPPSPIHLQIEPTNGCNMDCIFCAHSAVVDEPRSMSLEEFRRVIDQVHPRKITLSGYGEPLVNRSLSRMIAYAKSRGATVNTTSNLTLLRSEARARQLVRSGLDLLNVSIDAASPDTYLALRGQDLYDRVLNGVELLQRAKSQIKSNLPHIRVSFVISKMNLPEVASFVQLAHSLNADVAFFQMLQLTAIEEREEQLIDGVPVDRFRKALEEGQAVAHDLGLKTNLGKLLADLPDYWHRYDASEMTDKKCILPWFSAYVTADGSVRPCCAFAPVAIDMGGSLLERDFEEIWNSRIYQRFRRAHRKGQRPTSVCKRCVPESLLDIVTRARFSPGFFGTWITSSHTFSRLLSE